MSSAQQYESRRSFEYKIKVELLFNKTINILGIIKALASYISLSFPALADNPYPESLIIVYITKAQTNNCFYY